MAELTVAGPVLVHFFDFAQLNSVRALPYVIAWSERYAEHGLRTLGVHSPRFPFTGDPAAVAAARERFDIPHPVAVDSAHEMWSDYGCEGWPSLFLWGQGGALRWYHLGEGEYKTTEEAIQEALREADALREMPDLLMPIRATDIWGTQVLVPTEEAFPGGSIEEPFEGDGEAEISLNYQAGGAYATVDGVGEMSVSIPPSSTYELEVTHGGLYELATHPKHGPHRVVLCPAPGQRIYSVSFAPGVP
jgi:hypothetical protein